MRGLGRHGRRAWRASPSRHRRPMNEAAARANLAADRPCTAMRAARDLLYRRGRLRRRALPADQRPPEPSEHREQTGRALLDAGGRARRRLRKVGTSRARMDIDPVKPAPYLDDIPTGARTLRWAMARNSPITGGTRPRPVRGGRADRGHPPAVRYRTTTRSGRAWCGCRPVLTSSRIATRRAALSTRVPPAAPPAACISRLTRERPLRYIDGATETSGSYLEPDRAPRRHGGHLVRRRAPDTARRGALCSACCAQVLVDAGMGFRRQRNRNACSPAAHARLKLCCADDPFPV